MWATCYPDHCFCESIHASGFLQPSNTISSLIFVAAAIYVAYHYRNLFGCVYAVLLALIGFGSAYYHAHLDFVGQTIDNLGMYLLMTFVILSVMSSSRKKFLAWFVLLNATLLSLVIYLPVTRRYLTGGLVLILIWLIRSRNIDRKVFWTGVLLMAIAFTIWVFDITRVWCLPDSWFQGHAIWHILTALAAVLLFKSIQPILKRENK